MILNDRPPTPTPHDAVISVITYDLHIPATEVHHRDYPEVRARGDSLADAVRHLAHDMTRLSDTAVAAYDRESIDRALADVRRFVAQLSP
jgi:hypothetical protein